jgi:hypothetical protein
VVAVVSTLALLVGRCLEQEFHEVELDSEKE